MSQFLILIEEIINELVRPGQRVIRFRKLAGSNRAVKKIVKKGYREGKRIKASTIRKMKRAARRNRSRRRSLMRRPSMKAKRMRTLKKTLRRFGRQINAQRKRHEPHK
jgi:hypothetical protein